MMKCSMREHCISVYRCTFTISKGRGDARGVKGGCAACTQRGGEQDPARTHRVLHVSSSENTSCAFDSIRALDYSRLPASLTMSAASVAIFFLPTIPPLSISLHTALRAASESTSTVMMPFPPSTTWARRHARSSARSRARPWVISARLSDARPCCSHARPSAAAAARLAPAVRRSARAVSSESVVSLYSHLVC